MSEQLQTTDAIIFKDFVPSGLPEMGKHFAVEKVDVPAIDENSGGKVLAELLYLSVDPYMDVVSYSPGFQRGSPASGHVVVRIVKSLLPDVEVGKIYAGFGIWQKLAVYNEQAFRDGFWLAQPESPSTPLESNVGAFGMPGATAYFGYLELCKPKEGETLVVSGAAGAVGSLVCQLGKIRGCRVVAIAGSEDKMKYLKELGCDAVINYKTTQDMRAAIKEAAPNGVDQYFDNVGGSIKDAVYANLNVLARVAACGAISSYNLANPEPGPTWEWLIITKQLTISGFLVFRWKDQWPTAFKQFAEWSNEGKLKHEEMVVNGFENTISAFNQMMSGDNIGKVVVKV